MNCRRDLYIDPVVWTHHDHEAGGDVLEIFNTENEEYNDEELSKWAEFCFRHVQVSTNAMCTVHSIPCQHTYLMQCLCSIEPHAVVWHYAQVCQSEYPSSTKAFHAAAGEEKNATRVGELVKIKPVLAVCTPTLSWATLLNPLNSTSPPPPGRCQQE